MLASLNGNRKVDGAFNPDNNFPAALSTNLSWRMDNSISSWAPSTANSSSQMSSVSPGQSRDTHRSARSRRRDGDPDPARSKRRTATSGYVGLRRVSTASHAGVQAPALQTADRRNGGDCNVIGAGDGGAGDGNRTRVASLEACFCVRRAKHRHWPGAPGLGWP